MQSLTLTLDPELPAGPALYIVATPIGNLEDISLRALRVLAGVDLLLAEDTRTTSRLLHHYGLKTPLKSYRVHRQQEDNEAALRALQSQQRLALVSDAGTPGLSDPGSSLVRMVRDLLPDCPLVPIPGPSALTAALSASGWQTNPTLFTGFLSHKGGPRRRFLEQWRDFDGVLALYESVHRVQALLRESMELLPEREILVFRELTKRFEDIGRWQPGQPPERLLANLELRGEFTILLGPPGRSRDAAPPSGQDLP